MTNLEIIKALRVCGNSTECRQCPYFTKSARCVNDLMSDTLDLIIQQNAEVEKLKSICASKDIIIKDQEAKIERLTEGSKTNFDKWQILDDRTKERYAELYEEAKDFVRVQAIKEFTKKLRNRIINTPSKFSAEKGTFAYLSGSAHRQNEILDYIDNLVKEMTEDNK